MPKERVNELSYFFNALLYFKLASYATLNRFNCIMEKSLFFNMVFYFTKEHPSEVFNRALERPTTFTSILPSTRNILFYIFLFYRFTSADK